MKKKKNPRTVCTVKVGKEEVSATCRIPELGRTYSYTIPGREIGEEHFRYLEKHPAYEIEWE